MATTLVATVQADHVPPRVRLDITDTGTPAVTAATILRTHADGTSELVRTWDGAPLPLLASGSARTGLLYDYAAPFGQQATYSLMGQPSVTASVTVAVDRPWLMHAEVPSLSVPVEFKQGSFEQEQSAATQGVLYPKGRKRAVVITDGQRKAPSGSFTVMTTTPDELAAVLALVDDLGVLLPNVPPLTGLGIPWEYIAVQDVTVARRSDIGEDQGRFITMPYVVSEPPAGGVQPEWGWDDVAATYTWGQLSSLTWAQVLAGPNP